MPPRGPNAPSPLEAARTALHAHATPERAVATAKFFKTGKGDYGEGDRFIGVSVPDARRVARSHRGLSLDELEALMASPLHEERLLALLMLVDRVTRANAERATRRAAFELYFRRLDRVNNWDLVDLSAPDVVGGYLLDRDRRPLDALAASPDLWHRRVAMVACFAFIRRGDATDALRIAERLVEDEHDLIHKAVGWMLREVGKRVGLAPLRGFLTRHAATMPRTMLRYAIERLPDGERQRWLAVAPSARLSRGSRGASMKTAPTRRRAP